jgi:radical SAM superfamily enzyme YgiQ (UPF0313 family)
MPQQVIAELEALRTQNLPLIFIVDDNLIGNKKAIKEILRTVIAWQKANGYPLLFVTEASIDLADDEELMSLMVQANITGVFVGIESPDEDSLKEAKKFQNVRRGGTLAEKVRRIQDQGMEVWAGMILGFDNDDERIFDAHARFLTDARISTAMVGMLSAIPRTPLYDRLRLAGRLDEDDNPRFGTNVMPVKMTREALSEGYVRLMAELYDPVMFFERVDALYRDRRFVIDTAWRAYARQHRLAWLARSTVLWLETIGLCISLALHIPDRPLRKLYRRKIFSLMRARPEPSLIRIYALKCAVHWHMHKFVRRLTANNQPLVNSY